MYYVNNYSIFEMIDKIKNVTTHEYYIEYVHYV